MVNPPNDWPAIPDPPGGLTRSLENTRDDVNALAGMVKDLAERTKARLDENDEDHTDMTNEITIMGNEFSAATERLAAMQMFVEAQGRKAELYANLCRIWFFMSVVLVIVFVTIVR